MQTEYKTLCLPKNNLNLNIISAIVVGRHKKTCPTTILVSGGGGKYCASRFRERTSTSVSPGGDASPEDSAEKTTT